MPRYIDRVVRRQLPSNQLGAVLDVLITMLEAPDGKMKVSYRSEAGTVEAAMPRVAFDLLLDCLSLLASRNRVTLVAVDEGQDASPEDWAKIMGFSARWSGVVLGQSEVLPVRTDDKTDWYPLASLIEAFRGTEIERQNSVRTQDRDDPGIPLGY